MDSEFNEKLMKLMDSPIELGEVLMPGYKDDLSKIIELIIESAKKRFNYENLLLIFNEISEENSEIYADYLVRTIVIEYGTALDQESGLSNCKMRLSEVTFPMNATQVELVCEQLFQVLKKEFGAIQKMNYLTKKSIPISEIINKIKPEIEINEDDL